MGTSGGCCDRAWQSIVGRTNVSHSLGCEGGFHREEVIFTIVYADDNLEDVQVVKFENEVVGEDIFEEGGWMFSTAESAEKALPDARKNGERGYFRINPESSKRGGKWICVRKGGVQ